MVAALPISTVLAPKAEVVPIFPLRVIAPDPADSFILRAPKSVDAEVAPISPPIATVPPPVVIVKVRVFASELIVVEKSRFPQFEVMVVLASRTTAPLISISVVVEPSEAVDVVVIPPLRLIVPPVRST